MAVGAAKLVALDGPWRHSRPRTASERLGQLEPRSAGLQRMDLGSRRCMVASVAARGSCGISHYCGLVLDPGRRGSLPRRSKAQIVFLMRTEARSETGGAERPWRRDPGAPGRSRSCLGPDSVSRRNSTLLRVPQPPATGGMGGALSVRICPNDRVGNAPTEGPDAMIQAQPLGSAAARHRSERAQRSGAGCGHRKVREALFLA